jgi:hypothetical protein
MTRGELKSYIDAQRAEVLTSEYTDKKVQFFSRTAKIAADNGWGDLVVKSLALMNEGEYVDEGVSDNLAGTLEEFAEAYDVSIPENLRKESDDEPDMEGSDEEEIPAEQEELHRLLSDCSEENPLSKEDFRDLTTDELRTAGKLLQERQYWHEGLAAVPLAHVLANRESTGEAVDFLVKIIAEYDLMSWYIGGPGFERLADALVNISQDDALEAVLRAWRKSSILDEASYQTIFPQLMWIVKRTEGQIAAEELMSHTMQRLRRLFWPYEDWIQVWGKLVDT